MQNYADMSAEARLEALDAMATEYYGTAQWRRLFAGEFGQSAQTLTNWKVEKRTPVWACVAIGHALEARKLQTLRAILAQ